MKIIQQKQQKLTPTNSQNFSILHGARLPFRILQVCGFFPLSIKSNHNVVFSPIQIQYKAWFKSVPTLWLFALILTNIAPIFFGIFIEHDSRFKMPSTNSSKDGQTVFHIINMIWYVSSIVAPIGLRLDMLSWRSHFVSFFDDFVSVVKSLENCTIFTPLLQKHQKSVRIQFILHLIAQVTITIIFSAITTSYSLGSVGEESAFKFNVVAALQNLSFTLNVILINFGLHALIYFVANYKLIMILLLAMLRNKWQHNEARSVHKFENIINLYFSLEENVQEFSSIFANILNIYVLFSLGYLLFCMYFILILSKIKSYLLCWITVAQLLRFTCYFYWLANSASELEEKSKVFCKLPKRMYFNKGSSYANFGKDIAAVKLGKLWGDEVCR